MSNPLDASQVVSKLRDLQRRIRAELISARKSSTLHQVDRASQADTIYQLDTLIEPVIEDFCDDWSKTLPMVVVAEGLEPESGRCFPATIKPQDALVRVILDPIDGTRGLMYDKRPAWSLAGVARNKGDATRLADIEIAVMSELPTSKMSHADVLWAVKGQGANGVRESVINAKEPSAPLEIRPSTSDRIDHGFAMISNFFPGTKVLASELMEYLVKNLIGPADVTRATVFEDQYISTGGQLYELIVGHDRFNADLRPLFYKIQGQPEGMCVHPYDICTQLIALECGVQITDGMGGEVDGPLDVTTGIAWAGFANRALRGNVEPLVKRFLQEKGI